MVGGPGVDVISPAGVLAGLLGVRLLSAGDLAREHVQRGTPHGLAASRYMRSGHLVPDEVVVAMVAEALVAAADGWLLSGFPRQVGQAELLTRAGLLPAVVFELTLTEEDLTSGRWTAASGMWSAERRRQLPELLARYGQEAEPLRAYLRQRGLLRTASGYGEPDAVAARLVELLARGGGGGQAGWYRTSTR